MARAVSITSHCSRRQRQVLPKIGCCCRYSSGGHVAVSVIADCVSVIFGQVVAGGIGHGYIAQVVSLLDALRAFRCDVAGGTRMFINGTWPGDGLESVTTIWLVRTALSIAAGHKMLLALTVKTTTANPLGSVLSEIMKQSRCRPPNGRPLLPW